MSAYGFLKINVENASWIADGSNSFRQINTYVRRKYSTNLQIKANAISKFTDNKIYVKLTHQWTENKPEQ